MVTAKFPQILLFILMFLAIKPIHADLKWTDVDYESWPFDVSLNISDLAEFKSEMFLGAGRYSTIYPTESALWKSIDAGTTWSPITLPGQPDSTSNFISTNKYLFVQAVYLKANELTVKETKIFYTSDGKSWKELISMQNKTLIQATEVNNHWFFTGTNSIHVAQSNFLWKSSLATDPPEFIPVPMPDPDPFHLTMASLNNRLYLFSTVADGIHLIGEVTTSEDGETWAPSQSFPNVLSPRSFFKFPPVTYGGYIYWLSSRNLHKWDGASPITFDTTQSYNDSVIFNGRPKLIYDRLFTFPPNFAAAFALYLPGPPSQDPDEEDPWIEIPGEVIINTQTLDLYTATVGNRTLIIDERRAIRLDRGVVSLEANHASSARLISGEKDVELMNLKIHYNFEERIKNIILENKGTANNAREIERIRLVDGRGTGIKTITKFVPTGEKTWEFPIHFDWTPESGVEYYMVADISPNALNDATVALSIPKDGIDWAVGTHFEMSGPLQSSTGGQEIIGGTSQALDLVSDVLVYPTPARNTVHFQYDLSDGGDITIRLFDESGDLVSEIKENQKAPDLRATTSWNSANIAPGLYYAVLQIQPNTGDKRLIKKTVLIDR